MMDSAHCRRWGKQNAPAVGPGRQGSGKFRLCELADERLLAAAPDREAGRAEAENHHGPCGRLRHAAAVARLENRAAVGGGAIVVGLLEESDDIGTGSHGLTECRQVTVVSGAVAR